MASYHENETIQENDFAEDLVTLENEDGTELTYRVMRYFLYNGDEYVYLTGSQAPVLDEPLIMKVETETANGEEMETFLPLEDDMVDALLPIASQKTVPDDTFSE